MSSDRPDVVPAQQAQADEPHSARLLAQAYERAIYRIEGSDPRVLRVGERHGLEGGGALITACNPRSRRLRPHANARRLRALRRRIDRSGHRAHPARALDPSGQWPDEPSFWVPGLSLHAACALARAFRQNALLWCAPGAPAQLVWVIDRAPRRPKEPAAHAFAQSANSS